MLKPKALPEIESQFQFANRFGVSMRKVDVWIKEGLPRNDKRKILVREAIAWVEARSQVTGDEDPNTLPVDAEKREDFMARVGVGRVVLNEWIDAGMPSLGNGRIPVAPALLWLKQRGLPHAGDKKR